MLALTGCRLGEIVKLRWSEIDDVTGCFRLADTKEGASVRPIGKPVFDLLATITKNEGGDFVLPAVRGEGPFGGMPSVWRRIIKRAGFVGVTPHTLRHSFASVAGDLGYSDSSIGAMLGHSSGTMTSRYVHRLDAVLVAAAGRVATEIFEQMRARQV